MKNYEFRAPEFGFVEHITLQRGAARFLEEERVSPSSSSSRFLCLLKTIWCGRTIFCLFEKLTDVDAPSRQSGRWKSKFEASPTKIWILKEGEMKRERKKTWSIWIVFYYLFLSLSRIWMFIFCNLSFYKEFIIFSKNINKFFCSLKKVIF